MNGENTILNKYLNEFKKREDSYPENDINNKEKATISNKEHTLDMYTALKNTDTYFTCVFEYCDSNGNLYLNDGDYKICFKNTRKNKEKFAKSAAYFLGVELQVKVKYIENNVIYVYYNNYERDVPELKMEIESLLINDFSPEVVGRIKDVRPDHIIVDIFEKGIIGFCQKSNWSNSYIEDMNSVCTRGAFYSFNIINHGKYGTYHLSHVNFEENVWDKVNGSIESGETCIIKCIEHVREKGFWWGEIESFKGIQVQCNYPQNLNTNFSIEIGETYRCVVREIKAKEKVFRATPFSKAAAEGKVVIPKFSIERMNSKRAFQKYIHEAML